MYWKKILGDDLYQRVVAYSDGKISISALVRLAVYEYIREEESK